MFDAIFGRSVKILKILAKVQCVLAFVLASMLCGAVHEMLKPFSRFSAIVLGLVVAVVFWVLQMFLAWVLYFNSASRYAWKRMPYFSEIACAYATISSMFSRLYGKLPRVRA